jgi:hypothetical protein
VSGTPNIEIVAPDQTFKKFEASGAISVPLMVDQHYTLNVGHEDTNWSNLALLFDLDDEVNAQFIEQEFLYGFEHHDCISSGFVKVGSD